MLQRILIVAFAFVLAGGLLLLTLSAGDAVNPDSIARDDNIPLDRLPPHLDRQLSSEGRDLTPSNIREPIVIGRLKNGQTVEIRGKDSFPLADGAMRIVEPRARLFLKSSRAIVITAVEGIVQSPDNREVRNGELIGANQKVVLTLYEAPEGQRIQFGDDSPHVQLKAYLDNAHFDLELGQIESSGPVHMTSYRFDFVGEGLDLRYDMLQKHIAMLKVTRGELLRIKTHDPRPPEQRDALASGNRSSDTNSNSGKQSTPTDGANQTTDPPSSEEEDEAAQWYRAVFHDDVRILSRDTELHDALELVLFFATGGRERRTDPLDTLSDRKMPPSSSPSRPRPAPHRPLTSRTSQPLIRLASAPVTPRVQSRDIFRQHSLAPYSEDDIYVTWTGPLTLMPEAEAPAQAGGADDFLAHVHPARLRRTQVVKGDQREQTIRAARADYLASQRRLTLTGSQQQPLTMYSETLGELRSLSTGDPPARLVIRQNDGEGEWIGPGTMNTHGQAGLADRLQPSRALPPGTSLTWRNRVDLTFYIRDADEISQSDPLRIRGLRTIAFKGDAQARHPDFDIDAQTVAFDLNDPALGPQQVNALHARDGARLVTKPRPSLTRPTDPRLTVDAREMTVDLHQNEQGEIEPRRFLALGDVNAKLPDESIQSQQLDVTLEMRVEEPVALDAGNTARPGRQPAPLAPQSPLTADPFEEMALEPAPADPRLAPPALPDPADPGTDQPRKRIAIASIEARRDVTITATRSRTILKGDRAEVDPDAKVLQLEGTAGKFATVTSPDGVLKGTLITMRQLTEVVDVEGSGELVRHGAGSVPRPMMATDSQLLLDSDSTDDEDNSSTTTNVTWTRSMHFDNLRGEARFVGDFHLHTWNPTEQAHAWADEAELDFTPAAVQTDEASDEPADQTQEAFAVKMDTQGRKLLRLDAIMQPERDKDAVFLHETWTDDTRRELAQRIRLAGPNFSYARATQQMLVDGPGTMLIQDLTTQPDGEADDNAEQDDQVFATLVGERDREADGTATLDGKGDWLFRWEGRFEADALNNDLLMSRNVRMTHQPLGSDAKFRLYCQQLTADLESTGGVETWESKPTRPQLVGLEAHGAGPTQLGSRAHMQSPTRTIVADHMDYSIRDQLLILSAEPGRMVQLTNQGDPTTYPARKVRWNLATDKVRLYDPGAVIVPLR